MRLSLFVLPFALSLISSQTLMAQDVQDPASGWHCVTEHFSEALHLNETRKPLYSSLTGGKSEAISDALMDFEKRLTLGIQPTLPLARAYWRSGVPVLCREFVPIAETPEFAETFETPVPEGKVHFLNPYTATLRLEAAFLLGGYAKLAKAGRSEIRALDKADHFQCLVKHFLESIVLTAEVADEVNTAALTNGMPSTYWIYTTSIQSQFASLVTSSKLDRQAEELHRMGVPILCNDVPLILKDL